MASNDPRPVLTKAPAASPVITKSPLSVDDAELFASRIRPSWELVDDSLRSDLAADFGIEAPPAGAPRDAAPDTIIEGVPTLAIGVEVAAAASVADPAPALDPALARPSPTVADQAPQAPKPTLVDDPSPPEEPAGAGPTVSDDAEPAPAPKPAGKTKVGVGEPAVAKAPVSVRRVAKAAAPPPAVSASRPGEDDIELPIGGPPRGLLIKIGLGAAAAIGLVVIGVGVLGGKTPPPVPSATPNAATANAAPPRTDFPPPPTDPEPAATQAPAATAATAAAPTPSATASAAPSASAKAKVDPRPAPPPAVVPPPAKVVAPVPVADKAKPAVPAKKGGGIIRDSPF
jgi:hypothetical protein